jgi:hypothetical protein
MIEHPVKHRLRKGGKPSLAGIIDGVRTEKTCAIEKDGNGVESIVFTIIRKDEPISNYEVDGPIFSKKFLLDDLAWHREINKRLAERETAVGVTRKHKGGKPSIDGIVAPGVRSKVAQVALGNARMDALRELAVKRGLTERHVSELIREAVDALLERSA